MVNVIPPDHDHDVPVVEPNQHDDAPVVPEPVLEDEDENPKEDEFEEEEDPQEDEDDMEIEIEKDENEPELTFPYEEVDPLNPPPPASESEPNDEIEVENPIEHKDETIPVSVYEVGESSTAAIPQEDGNEVRSSVEQGTAAMENLVEKLENNERVERDLYWTRVRAHEFYQEIIHRGFMFKERLNEAIDVPIEDEKSPLSEPQGSPSSPKEMIKENVDAAIAVERERKVKVRNDASGSGPVRGQNTALAIRECTFAGFMKCNPTIFRRIEGAIELRRWFEKTESVFGISECAKGKKIRFATATLEGPALTWWNSKVETLGLENVNQMPWTEMKQLMTAEFCLI
ncbi:hypothetical protein Tco_1568729, partial [Tanacetum coccineum]